MSGREEAAPPLFVPDGWTAVDLVERVSSGEPFLTRAMPNAPRVGEEVWVGRDSAGPGGQPLAWSVYRVERVSYLSPDPAYSPGPLRCRVRAEVVPLTTLAAEGRTLPGNPPAGETGGGPDR